MIRIFKKQEDQNEKLLKNIERYEQKKKVLYKEVKGCKVYGIWYE